MNRLSLYVFYDRNGKLRDFDKYYLNSLSEISDTVVLVNGLISSEDREFLKSKGYAFVCRDNVGFDFAAWKEYFAVNIKAISSRYDEVILCNCSCYGPVFPFERIFSQMSSVECDFWGLCRHPGANSRYPAHLQSYFLVLRSRLFKDSSFIEYFNSLKTARNWQEAVNQETHFTKYFEDKGFTAASFIDDSLSKIYPDASIILPERLLELGFPFVKRKVFSVDYSHIQSYTDGTYIRAVLDFLRNRTSYPVDLIKKDILNSLPNSQIRNVFHLTYALDSKKADSSKQNLPESKSSVAAILFSYYEDLVEQNIRYLSALPKNCHLFIVVLSEKMKNLWEQRLKPSGYKYEIRMQRNRGRNEAAYWLTCRDVIHDFDYICLIHDKKTPSAHPPVRGVYFAEHCLKNVLFSEEYVLNVIRLFDSHPDLGLLMPTVPMFGDWPNLILNREWGRNREVAKEVYDRLKLGVPFDEHPAAPWGAMFWIRGLVMAAFYRYSWTPDDFPEEPIKVTDGTVLHAMERMYPMIAQESGYLSAWIVPSGLIGTYYDNLYSKTLEYKAEYDTRRFQTAPKQVSSNALPVARWTGPRGNEPLFFPEGYLEMYPDIAKAGVDPWRHYVLFGMQEGRDNGLHPTDDVFFMEGYLEMYPDASGSKTELWRNYVLVGKKEGRDNGLHPGDDLFFAEGYLAMYPDVEASGFDPWHHYVLYGKEEGRDNGLHPGPDAFFPEGYRYNYPSCINEPYSDNLWLNYVKIGKYLDRNNGLTSLSPFFNGVYLERHPGASLRDAWKDYVLNSLKHRRQDLILYPEYSVTRKILKKVRPSVAVIMPVYNRKGVVMQAIASVLNQSWANWHLYVVDDFSEDGTWDYLKSAIQDPRITLLKSKYKGVCGARNTAAKQIKEDYVAYLDSDNTWNREYLELMLCRLLEAKTICCYGAQKITRTDDYGSVETLGFRYNVLDTHKIRNFNFIDLNVFMHRSSVFREIGYFDVSLRRMVDWDFILRCAEKYSFSRLPYAGCNYDDTEDENRISQSNSYTFNYMNVIRNNHWFDWDVLSECSSGKDDSLVSVIVCYGKDDSLPFLKNCLNSLKKARSYGHSKYRTEVILVDDSCSDEMHETVSEFYDSSLIDRCIVNNNECGFPLSCNSALSLANGSFSVFLDSHSYVFVNWLDPLIKPLKRHQELKGTTARVLQPDGVINSIGCLFDSVSGLPYDLLHDLPSSLPASQRLTLLPCVNSYCCAFRTNDLLARKGLYCIYSSGLAVADMCMQLGNGRPVFAYIPSSTVICPADSSLQPARTNDLEPFAEGWFGNAEYDEEKFFARRDLNELIKTREKAGSVSFKKFTKTAITKHSTDYFIPVYDFPRLGYSCALSSEMRDVISRMKAFSRLVVIKDPAPGIPYDKKYEWGDYYFARSLARSFEKLGFDTRIDSLEDWYSHDDGVCINIVLRGITKFECISCPDSFNVMWLISHPDMIYASELNEYDCVFAASEFLADKYSALQSVHVPCVYLPQCTDPEVFLPAKVSEAYISGNLFVGNSRGVMRDAVKKCLDEDVDIQIIGNGWNDLVKPELIRSGAVPSFLVPFLYRSAEAVLNDHWDDMRQNRIASNRIFDVLACGRGIVTDNFESIPEELKFACFSYEKCSIKEAIDKCRSFNKNITKEQKEKLRNIICDRFSFDRRTLQIAESLYPILEKR